MPIHLRLEVVGLGIETDDGTWIMVDALLAEDEPVDRWAPWQEEGADEVPSWLLEG